MRVLVIALVLAAVGAFAMPHDYAVQFAAFKKQYNRQYPTKEVEQARFRIFVENMKKASQLNKVNPKAKFGANEFADMSAAEFKSRHNSDKLYAKFVAAQKPVADLYTPAQLVAGKAIDWRTKGAVTPVKNQGQCGSCWSFSTTGGIEGQWFLAGNPLTSLSEQELVSCDTIDSGCNGGLMDQAMEWLLQAHGGSIVTEASYPYVSGNGEVPACSMTNTAVGATIGGHQDLPHNEDQMATWVYSNGPLSIAVDATSWQTYQGGIMTNCISNQIDHGVLIVGFDDNNSPPYWIIKNSWAASWGENGYIRVQKGTDQCLITSLPCTSIINGTNPPGPTPPGPTPPTPPGPTPPSPSGTFQQLHCTDSNCQKCKTETLPQGKCIKGGKKNSFKAVCITDGLLIEAFEDGDCKGKGTYTTDPVDVCSVIFNKDNVEEFVLNSCGANPPGPTPPGPNPTSSPAPAGGTFTQMDCSDAACSQNCQNATFPQNQCLQLNGGGSAIAVCQPTQLLLTEYPVSSTCTGTSVPDPMPINQCLQSSNGGYFENICSNTGAARKAEPMKLNKQQTNFIRNLRARRN